MRIVVDLTRCRSARIDHGRGRRHFWCPCDIGTLPWRLLSHPLPRPARSNCMAAPACRWSCMAAASMQYGPVLGRRVW